MGVSELSLRQGGAKHSLMEEHSGFQGPAGNIGEWYLHTDLFISKTCQFQNRSAYSALKFQADCFIAQELSFILDGQNRLM